MAHRPQERAGTSKRKETARIQQALGHDRNEPRNNILDTALFLRDRLYELIEERDERIDCRHCWVIATLPDKKKRQELAGRLKAELIHIDTPMEECIARAEKDDRRHDKQLARAIIEEYFEKFQP